MTTARRRWFAFSLWTMFLGLALTGGLIAVGVRYFPDWYYPAPAFPVFGSLGRADIAAICDAISSSPQVPVRIIRHIIVRSPAEVDVSTGAFGPRGHSVTLVKKTGNWRITRVNVWLE